MPVRQRRDMPCPPTGSSSIHHLICGHANKKIEVPASCSQTDFQTEIPTEACAKTDERSTIAEQNHDICIPYM